MKPVNPKRADSFAQESVSGVDAVFGRMLEVLGNPYGSYAQAFDVSENTIKTWRRRGAVSLRYLEGFAKAHGTTIDYLMNGAGVGNSDEPPLTAEEQLLLERFRASPRELRDAALRVLLGAPAEIKGVSQTFNAPVTGGVAGRDIVKTGKKRRE